MAKYSYITDKTHNNRKIQVESAKRDGSGKNIENNYAKQNGNYQSLTAGLSNNFDTKKVMVDESAYNFRQTATMGSVELEVGSPCKVKKIIGGSVAFNQLMDSLSTQSGYQPRKWYSFFVGDQTYSFNNGEVSVSSNQGSLEIGQKITIEQNHKVLLCLKAKASEVDDKLYIEYAQYGTNALYQTSVGNITTSYKYFSSIATNTSGMSWFGVRMANNVDRNRTLTIRDFMCIDLTQMFGSAIADYIYSLEQANAGSGVAWFKRYFPKEYYAYNSGELVSVKTQGKKITHFNQWDEEVEKGLIDPSTGLNVSNTGGQYYRSINYISVLPSTNYFAKLPNGFTSDICNIAWFYYDRDKNYIGNRDNRGNVSTETPSNSYFAKFVVFFVTAQSTMPSGVCINFYDGDRDGEYEPYNSETYPCDDIELRGIPQLDENNNLAFDGDEYANDGNVTRKYGIVDLGTLTWTRISQDPEYDGFFNAQVGNIKSNTNNVMCKLFVGGYSNYAYASMPNMTIRVEGDGVSFTIKDTDYTDTQIFKTAMSGVYLVYELATPTDENSIPFTEVQECDNWGTEEWLAPTTDTRPCEVPVGHETDYLPDLKAKVEVAPNTPNENGVYVMEHNASGNSYTPIATWLANNGYKTEETMKDTFGMKDALGGTLRQCLCVKESLDFDNTAYVDLGSLSWTIYDTNVYVCYPPNLASYSNDGVASPNILCSNYKIVARDYVASSNDEKAIGQKSNSILFYSSTKNATQIQAFMKGVLLAYEKES